MTKINGRAKGHAYERKLRNEFRQMGWEECETSRFESKKLDDAKVDLTCTHPFSIQAKAVEKSIDIHRVLSEMPDDSNYNLVFHKRNYAGEVVSMRKEDFYEIIMMLKANGVL